MADIPTAESYVRRMEVDPGQAILAGFNAGSRRRASEQDNRARADALAQQKIQQQEQLAMQKAVLEQRKAEQKSDVERDTLRRADMLAEKFGPSRVLLPNGDVDVAGSAKAAQERVDFDRKSEFLGMQVELGGQQLAPEYKQFESFPGFSQGRMKGMILREQQQDANARAKLAADSRMDVAKVRAGGGSSGDVDKIEEVNGIPMIRTAKGNLKQLSEDARSDYERAKKARAGTNAPPNVKGKVTYDKNGNPVFNVTK